MSADPPLQKAWRRRVAMLRRARLHYADADAIFDKADAVYIAADVGYTSQTSTVTASKNYQLAAKYNADATRLVAVGDELVATAELGWLDAINLVHGDVTLTWSKDRCECTVAGVTYKEKTTDDKG